VGSARGGTFVAFVAGVAVGALGLGIARGQGTPPPAPFEYRLFRMDPQEYAGKSDYEEIRKKHGGDGLKTDCEFQEYVLNTLAKEGWELQLMERPRPNLVHFYLRRPAPR
jgi:hypothetical protein